MNCSIVLRELPPSITLAEAYGVLCRYGDVMDCSMLQRLRRTHHGHHPPHLGSSPQFEAQVAVLYATPEAAHHAVAEMNNSRTAFAHPGMLHMPLIAELGNMNNTSGHHSPMWNSSHPGSRVPPSHPPPPAVPAPNPYQAPYAPRQAGVGSGYMPQHTHNASPPPPAGYPGHPDAVNQLQHRVEQLQRQIDRLHGGEPKPEPKTPASAPTVPAPYGSQAPHVVGEGRVFVGNLPLSTQQRKLAALFQPYGELLEVFVFRRPQAETGGRCAFVRFADMECAKRAVADLNGITFMDRSLLVKMAPRKAKQHTEPEQPAAAPQPQTSAPQSPTQPTTTQNTTQHLLDSLEACAATTESLSGYSRGDNHGLMRMSRSVEYIRPQMDSMDLRSAESSGEHSRSYLGVDSTQAISSADSTNEANDESTSCSTWQGHDATMRQLLAQLGALASEVPERGLGKDWKGPGMTGQSPSGSGAATTASNLSLMLSLLGEEQQE